MGNEVHRWWESNCATGLKGWPQRASQPYFGGATSQEYGHLAVPLPRAQSLFKSLGLAYRTINMWLFFSSYWNSSTWEEASLRNPATFPSTTPAFLKWINIKDILNRNTLTTSECDQEVCFSRSENQVHRAFNPDRCYIVDTITIGQFLPWVGFCPIR